MCAQSLFRESLDLFATSTCTFQLENAREVKKSSRGKLRAKRKITCDKANTKKENEREQEGRVQIDTSKCQNFISVAFVSIS
jgi:hypothetical protein